MVRRTVSVLPFSTFGDGRKIITYQALLNNVVVVDDVEFGQVAVRSASLVSIVARQDVTQRNLLGVVVGVRVEGGLDDDGVHANTTDSQLVDQDVGIFEVGVGDEREPVVAKIGEVGDDGLVGGGSLVRVGGQSGGGDGQVRGGGCAD